MTIRLSARQRKRERRDSEHSPGKLAVLKFSFRAVNQSPDNMPKAALCSSLTTHSAPITYSLAFKVKFQYSDLFRFLSKNNIKEMTTN